MGKPYIRKDQPPTPILGRGRPRGQGPNQKLLGKLTPGELHSCIWDLTAKKMRSIKSTASLLKIKIKIRKLEHSKFAIWRIT